MTENKNPLRNLLVVGATGSVGRLVVAEAVRQGYETRALVRSRDRANNLDKAAEIVIGQLTDSSTLTQAVAGADAVVFTQGSSYGDSAAAEAVDYGAVWNILRALGGRPVRIALMTAIGVTVRSATHDWKRRGERLIRASGNDYTIVRPGWFDYNDADQLKIELLQGDTRRAGSPADGVIARHQIARVLIDSLSSAAAARKTFELVTERGPAQDDLTPLFEALKRDQEQAVDGISDQSNLPTRDEPQRVLDDLASIRPKT